ncbi:MAG: hypothetical protein EVJ46_05020 [Candidatus Acididesulfobacter guangdongensis]|uniref:Sulfur reduction protein DsrE n=1 Tax=Acididesulfobacter guangdongensis TaxID=2597225 RepID=A0A519BGJ9_ACIG2|nr:MAG: hypothetical protein EVJ46_05020 [Candidatus Acididesulfobacter guangdongensis]
MQCLAFIITDDRYKKNIKLLIDSAVKSGCSIKCFLTDRGVLLTEDKWFVQCLLNNSNISVDICEYSCNINGIKERIAQFNYSSQFENAKTVHDLSEGDRLINF